jgi:hypothetical protein
MGLIAQFVKARHFGRRVGSGSESLNTTQQRISKLSSAVVVTSAFMHSTHAGISERQSLWWVTGAELYELTNRFDYCCFQRCFMWYCSQQRLMLDIHILCAIETPPSLPLMMPMNPDSRYQPGLPDFQLPGLDTVQRPQHSHLK